MTKRHPWTVLSIVVAGLALWMGLGTLHDYHHADSLLPVLVSTQRWTPFFWGQDRFGMLVPLLAMPIRHPLENLLVQGWMMAAAGLLAPFAAARFLSGRYDPWIPIGAGANLLFLLLATPGVQFDWLVAQPYGLSMCLGFGGLTIADRSPRAGATIVAGVLLVLACWINVGVVVMLSIATCCRSSSRVRLLAMECVAATFAVMLARYAADAHTVTAVMPPGQWVVAWTRLAQNCREAIASPGWAAIVALATAVAIGRLWERGGPAEWRPAGTALAMAAGTWLVTGTSLWIAMNSYVFRYMYPVMMLIAVGVAAVFAMLLAKRAAAVSTPALIALTVVTCVRYGTPSVGRVERGIDERFGARTAAIVRSGATVIAGDYWAVWPAVFHANLTLARSHSRARIFGLTYRSTETDGLWKVGGRQILIAAASGDASVGAVAEEHSIAVTPFDRLPSIDLYTGVPGK